MIDAFLGFLAKLFSPILMDAFKPKPIKVEYAIKDKNSQPDDVSSDDFLNRFSGLRNTKI